MCYYLADFHLSLGDFEGEVLEDVKAKSVQLHTRYMRRI
jgi:hypothetical protein